MAPPTFIGPKGHRPEVLVDQYRVLLVDNEGNEIGQPGNYGAGGRIGRLVYASRTLSNRGY